MHWGIFVILAGVVAGALAQAEDPSVDSVRPRKPSRRCCGKNEHYESYSNRCQITCENMHLEYIMGACKLTGACYCNAGYVRNKNGICIKRKNCPNTKPCDDPNAERLECAPHPSCRSTCATPNPSTCLESCAINQCVCKKGYVLSEVGGKCIAVNECPKDVPCNGDSNAVIKANPIPCPSTCSAPNAGPWCKRAVPPVGCECKPGYLQVEDGGKCIKPDQCPGGNPCGVNGTFVWCAAGCPTNNCPVSDSLAMIACMPPYPCPNGCACKQNYKRISSTNDRCILASDCPPVKCTRPNEVWDSCPSVCLRESCADVDDQPTVCNTLVATQCRPRCVCQKGYFRNNDGICVPANECPSCPKGEVYNECGSSCPPSCGNKGNTCLMCTQQCVPGCYCEGKTIRAPDGTCVLPENCPPRTCTGQNEEFVECPPTCPRTENCSNLWTREPCDPIDCCTPQCRCKSGFFRNAQNKCVSGKECSNPTGCGPNEVSTDCYNDCQDQTCKGRFTSPEKLCTQECGRTGCICQPGLYRHDNGTCVPENECSPVPCDKPNEVWDSCPSDCLREYCGDVDDQPTVCNTLVATQCRPRCVCQKGYFRNNDGICVPANECPNQQQCSDPNAERVQCAPVTNCRPTCDKRTPGPCILMCVVDDCVCKKGYILSKINGTCIPEDQCPASCPKGEVYNECGSSCPPSCGNKGNTCLVCTRQCVPGCYCEGKTIRAPDGTCVLPENCPPRTCTGQNEEFVECPPTCPKTEKCSNLWTKEPCDPIDCCTPQCRCKSGFFRNDQNICVSAKECMNPPLVCGPNEVSSSCYNECQDQTCKERLTGPEKLCTQECGRIGCICQPGFFRHDNGTCVPESQCSPPKCPAGEAYTDCGSSCPASCESRGNTCRMCTMQCVPGCFCAEGTIRAPDGTCVPPEKCPPRICTGQNEEFDKCPPTCPRTQNCSNIWSKIPCDPIDCCEPQCRCKSGYFRNDQNICVSGKECSNPNPGCGPNEVSTDCYNDCQDRTCKERITGPEKLCTQQCGRTGCICQPGFFRHDNGSCVPESQCSPPNCPAGEVYNECGSSCPASCENIGNTCLACTKQCVPGCYCAGKTIRAQNGSCVLPENCPKPKCTGPNEIFDKCPPTCPKTESCSNLWSKFACTPIDCCKPQCRCRSGYYRNAKNICITGKQCTGQAASVATAEAIVT